MKNILRDSRIIRWYIQVVCALIVGFLLAIIFSGKLSFARYVAAGGFVLGIVCFILLVLNIETIDKEIRSRYVSATHGEKRFLNYLFYFAWGQCLFLGLLIWGLTLSHDGIIDKNLVEVKGKISEVSVYGGKNQYLKIKLVGKSNDYEIRTFLIGQETLEKIERELHPGVQIYLTVKRKDENNIDARYISTLETKFP